MGTAGKFVKPSLVDKTALNFQMIHFLLLSPQYGSRAFGIKGITASPPCFTFSMEFSSVNTIPQNPH